VSAQALPAGLGLPILTTIRILPIRFDGYNPQARCDASFVPALDPAVRKGEDHVIVGIGIDHVDSGRIADLLERFGERGERRLFTAGELARCRDRPRPAECLAARFAAKEAFVKALGTGMKGMKWTDVEVRGSEGEPPRLVLHGGAKAAFEARGGEQAHVSLTHEAGSAIAIVIIEGRVG
jgi:holo-[acyl-carrier protein] synthase